MKFFDDTGAVLVNVLRVALFGAAADLALEIISGWNAAGRPNKKALFVADLAWCVLSAVCFFILLLAFADGSLRLRMLTAEEDDGIKPNNVELDPTYQGPEVTPTPTPTPTNVKTGDEAPVKAYVLLMVVSGVLTAALAVRTRRAKAEK